MRKLTIMIYIIVILFTQIGLAQAASMEDCAHCFQRDDQKAAIVMGTTSAFTSIALKIIHDENIIDHTSSLKAQLPAGIQEDLNRYEKMKRRIASLKAELRELDKVSYPTYTDSARIMKSSMKQVMLKRIKEEKASLRPKIVKKLKKLGKANINILFKLQDNLQMGIQVTRATAVVSFLYLVQDALLELDEVEEDQIYPPIDERVIEEELID